jgi:acylphosphatase
VPAARFVVSGLVQGVGFRYFARSTGRAFSLAGWVRNTADARVEAIVAGSAAALDEFEARLREGPAGARVDAVSREPIEKVEGLPLPFAIIR